MHRSVHTLGYDRLDLGRPQDLSLAALELLVHVVPTDRYLTCEIKLVPHSMANLAVFSLN